MKYLILLLSLCFIACSKNDPNAQNNVNWLIDQDQVLDGGPGKDGIPSIDNPNFSRADNINFLQDDDLVLAYRSGNIIKAYPHPILDWHEIINDEINSENIALTYCPLTGTGIGWGREIDGKTTTFGVSGLIYNTNLMPYDRETNSTWSQLRLDCVSGEKIGEEAKLFSFFETSWASWKQAYSTSRVLNDDTGFSRNYGTYPYQDYKTNNNALIFPVSNDDTRLPRKERVLAVTIGEKQKAYPFGNNESNELIEDIVDGIEITVIRNKSMNYLVAFEGHDFQVLDESEFPQLIIDDNGVKYDVFGFSDSTAEPIRKPIQLMSYWFALGAFRQDVDLYME